MQTSECYVEIVQWCYSKVRSFAILTNMEQVIVRNDVVTITVLPMVLVPTYLFEEEMGCVVPHC